MASTITGHRFTVETDTETGMRELPRTGINGVVDSRVHSINVDATLA